MRTLIQLCALLCFGSFGWGMIWHFRRFGRPSGALFASAFLAIASALVNAEGLMARGFEFPLVAIVLYALSCGLFWSAVAVTRGKLVACWQDAVSSSKAVVASGPYRFVRHPFYLAYDLAWIAGYAATGWWPIAVTALAMALVYDGAARREELVIQAGPLADTYRRYKKTAGRYWPHFRVRGIV